MVITMGFLTFKVIPRDQKPYGVSGCFPYLFHPSHKAVLLRSGPWSTRVPPLSLARGPRGKGLPRGFFQALGPVDAPLTGWAQARYLKDPLPPSFFLCPPG